MRLDLVSQAASNMPAIHETTDLSTPIHQQQTITTRDEKEERRQMLTVLLPVLLVTIFLALITGAAIKLHKDRKKDAADNAERDAALRMRRREELELYGPRLLEEARVRGEHARTLAMLEGRMPEVVPSWRPAPMHPDLEAEANERRAAQGPRYDFHVSGEDWVDQPSQR